MSIPISEKLPTLKELTVDEIALGGVPMYACSKYMGQYCYEQSKEFLLCSSEEKDPRKCLAEGKAVTSCGIDFLKLMKSSCAKEFYVYWNCLSRGSYDLSHRFCRKPQGAFDSCMTEKMNMRPPPKGYFAKTHVHHTSRPKPKRDIPLPEAVPAYPDFENTPTPPGFEVGPSSIMH